VIHRPRPGSKPQLFRRVFCDGNRRGEPRVVRLTAPNSNDGVRSLRDSLAQQKLQFAKLVSAAAKAHQVITLCE
jgi:hypothetical protein